ncbi:MAG: hypothetical protein AAF628_28355 [Planctomycetota bacterium]
MSGRHHGRLLAYSFFTWLTFYLIGPPDDYQHWPLAVKLAVVPGVTWLYFPVTRLTLLRLWGDGRHFRNSLWLAAYLTVPLFVYDYLLIAIWWGLGMGFVVPYWYLTRGADPGEARAWVGDSRPASRLIRSVENSPQRSGDRHFQVEFCRLLLRFDDLNGKQGYAERRPTSTSTRTSRRPTFGPLPSDFGVVFPRDSGCNVRVSLDLQAAGPFTTGIAHLLGMRIPNNPALRADRFFCRVLTWQPASFPALIQSSNGLDVTLQ